MTGYDAAEIRRELNAPGHAFHRHLREYVV